MPKGKKLASFSQTIRLFTSKVIIYYLLISMASHPQGTTATINYNCQHQEAQMFQNNSLKSLILKFFIWLVITNKSINSKLKESLKLTLKAAQIIN